MTENEAKIYSKRYGAVKKCIGGVDVNNAKGVCG